MLFRYLDIRGLRFIPLISTQELKFYEPPMFLFPVMKVFYFGVIRFISCVMLWACCWIFVPAGGKRRCNLPASVMVAEQAFMLELSSGCRAGPGRAGPGDQLRDAGTHSEILMTYWREGLNLPLVIPPSLPPLIYLPAAPSLSLFLSPLLFVYLSLPLPPPLSPSLSLRRVVRLCYVTLKRQERCKVKNTT